MLHVVNIPHNVYWTSIDNLITVCSKNRLFSRVPFKSVSDIRQWTC